MIFNAMRAMYMVTRCVLKGFGKLLEIIEMYKRIKQGAPPSMILSMIFMDDLVETLKRKCIVKPILYDLIFYYMHMILKCSIVNCLWKNVLIEAITEKKKKKFNIDINITCSILNCSWTRFSSSANRCLFILVCNLEASFSATIEAASVADIVVAVDESLD